MKKIILISLSFIVIFSFSLIGTNKNFNSRGSDMNIKKTRIAFGSYLIDKSGQRLLEPIALAGSCYKGEFVAGGYFDKDITFNIILLNNYRQIAFSIDGSEKSKNQKLFINKNTDNKYKFYKHTIEADNVTDSLNDMILVFTQQYDEKELDTFIKDKKVHKSTYLVRFNLVKDTQNNNIYNIDFSKDYKVLKNSRNALFDMFIYDKEFDGFSEAQPTYDILKSLKINYNQITLPISINTGTAIEGSASYNEYLEDQRLDKSETLAVFCLLNGNLEPAIYNREKGEKELVHFYHKKFKDVIMINPYIEINKSGINTFSAITVCYPMSNEYIATDTYHFAKWSAGIASNEVLIIN